LHQHEGSVEFLLGARRAKARTSSASVRLQARRLRFYPTVLVVILILGVIVMMSSEFPARDHVEV
jgi:hypothetical protein